tara:strand:+ start:117 stop:761 length:645 start_codon:yes stop_codon:yes gene_type:complete
MPTEKKNNNIGDDIERDVCTNRKLNYFGLKHYTYINQIFGDETIREIIMKLFYERIHLDLRVEIISGDNCQFPEGGMHHYVYDKNKKIHICSTNEGYQNTYINKNDTLCQSYSLLTFVGVNIWKHSSPKRHKQNQMKMVQFYRSLIKNPAFIDELRDIELGDFVNYTQSKSEKVQFPTNMSVNKLIKRIENTLDSWEKYGYKYFIGDGKCDIDV